MGSKTRLPRTGIQNETVSESALAPGVATNAKFGSDAIDSGKIADGSIVGADFAPSIDLSPKTVTLPSTAINFDRENFNVSLLGFKMAVNESLTVFNLVDGVVDEFHDESGTDESESSNDTYVAAQIII